MIKYPAATGRAFRMLSNRLRQEDGTSLVEFALVLPLLLLLLFAIVDFGKAINYWLDETHLANEGARWAAVDNWPTKGTQSLAAFIQQEAGGLSGELQSGTSGGCSSS